VGQRLFDSPALQRAAGIAAAAYLRFVWRSGRLVTDLQDLQRDIGPHMPCIVATWHGQHFLVSFARSTDHDFRVLISLSRDGGIQTNIAHRLGLGVIRGSGGAPGTIHRKRGDAALRQMLAALRQGASIALTADVPKISRVVGPGIIALARHSGRPIIPVAVVTSARLIMRSWDRASINVPFSRIACVAGDPIVVPDTQDDRLLEECRRDLQSSLNDVNARALMMAGARRS
jgi:lysophospholipid acyltransferase (LPLAT)-like uncharacterized protein